MPSKQPRHKVYIRITEPDDGYLALSGAIIIELLKEYESALKNLNKVYGKFGMNHYRFRDAAAQVKRIRNWADGDYYTILSLGNGLDDFLRAVENKVGGPLVHLTGGKNGSR